MRSATFSACSPLFTPLVPTNDAHFRFHFFVVFFRLRHHCHPSRSQFRPGARPTDHRFALVGRNILLMVPLCVLIEVVIIIKILSKNDRFQFLLFAV